ncbi:hypothetical protein CsatB_012143 [Cannabis sativa]
MLVLVDLIAIFIFVLMEQNVLCASLLWTCGPEKELSTLISLEQSKHRKTFLLLIKIS